jgi:hypothetical protein
MTSRSVIGHLLLAIAGLGLAFGFYVRSRGGAAPTDNAVLLDLHKRDISRLTWSDEGKTVTVEERKTSEGDSYWWITSDTTKNGKTEKKEMRGSAEVDKLLDGFAPLRASRALGTMPDEKLKEFGLTASKKSIEIVTPSGTQKIILGDNEYGSDQRYVQDPRDSHVYLIKGFVLSNLENAATRYMEHSLHHFAKSDIDRALITVNGKSIEVIQQNRLEPGKSFWVRAGAPDKREDTIGNWMDRVLALNAMEYASTPPATTEVFRVTFRDTRSQLGTIQLLKAPTPDGKGTDYYAVSDHTVIPVRLHSGGDEVAKEVDKIVGG